MHVLLVCSTMSLGGVERYLMDLANSLAERGIKVTVAFGGPVLHKPGFVDEVRYCEINLVRGHLGLFRLIVDFRVGKTLYKYIRDADVDIVNTTMVDSGIWCWMAGRCLGTPTFYTPMHASINYSKIERFMTSNTLGVNIIKSLRIHFIAVSDYFTWELANIGKVPTNYIHTAVLGVDLSKFEPKAADNSIRKEFGLGPGPIIGTIGRLRRVKGCHKIIAAMPAILKICPEAQLLIVGDGLEREALERQAKDLQVRDNVIFAGWRTNTVEMTNLLDVYVAATDGPNLGLSVLQALAQGKPLVVFASDELEERMATDTVQESLNGYIVPTNEPDKAGEIIGKMLNDTHLLKEMGQASRKLAEERFDWRLHVSKVIEIYQRLKDGN